MAQELVGSLGYQVITVASGREAIDYLEKPIAPDEIVASPALQRLLPL